MASSENSNFYYRGHGVVGRKVLVNMHFLPDMGRLKDETAYIKQRRDVQKPGAIFYKINEWRGEEERVFRYFSKSLSRTLKGPKQFKPFQIISNHFKRFQTISNHFKPFQTISKHFKSFQSISKHFKAFQSISKHFKTFQNIPKHFKAFPNILDHFKTFLICFF